MYVAVWNGNTVAELYPGLVYHSGSLDHLSHTHACASCRYRIGEVLTAYKLLTSMSKGEAVQGLSLSGKANPTTLLQGMHIYKLSCTI